MPQKSRKAWRPKRIKPTRPPPRGPVWTDFVDSYLETALWSSFDDEGNSLDDEYSTEDFSHEALSQAIMESTKFIDENWDDLIESGGSEDRHGHDFWLTRNRHGAGFWDRGYDDIGKRLTEAAHAYGELYIYAGDDGLLYFS